jgi:hypothetical protein
MSSSKRLVRFLSTKIVSSLFSPSKPELFVGRWITPTSNSKKNIDIMIDRNNEDHCGGCDEKTIDTVFVQEKQVFVKKDDEDYYRAFFL